MASSEMRASGDTITRKEGGMASLNPYETLGLDKKTATPEKIRKAYRKRAAQAHPDNPRPVGDFFAIQQANRILSDPNAKQIYDETGIVMGEDKLAEEAIMLIVMIAAQIQAKKPTCDLPAMLRATLDELRKQTLASAALVEKWIKQVEKRWKGAEAVKRHASTQHAPSRDRVQSQDESVRPGQATA